MSCVTLVSLLMAWFSVSWSANGVSNNAFFDLFEFCVVCLFWGKVNDKMLIKYSYNRNKWSMTLSGYCHHAVHTCIHTCIHLGQHVPPIGYTNSRQYPVTMIENLA